MSAVRRPAARLTPAHATSRDGTRIAYATIGVGPPIVLVDGAACMRAFGPNVELARALASRFTVLTYDRRGRGESADTPPYSVARELEDLAAVIAVLAPDARAHDAATLSLPLVFGTSSGAVLAARAAASGVPMRTLVLHEPPLRLEGAPLPSPADYRERVQALVASGRPSQALTLFFRAVGIPRSVVWRLRLQRTVWRRLVAAAPSLAYDFAVLGDSQLGHDMPAELATVFESIRVPTTILAGTASPAWMQDAAARVGRVIASASVVALDGQRHWFDAEAVAAALNSPSRPPA